MDEYWRGRTPQALLDANTAVFKYVELLYPVIGSEEASKYEASARTLFEAIDRLEQLTASVAGSPSADTAHGALLRQLRGNQGAALSAFMAAADAVDNALAKARNLDQGDGDVHLEPDEKGGA